jgi:hypothetical protein
MRFAVFDHNDSTGRPPATQLAERLSLIEAYERLGYYAYQMAEHHGTPLGIATPHLMLAAASQRTSTIKLGTLISILPLLPPMRRSACGASCCYLRPIDRLSISSNHTSRLPISFNHFSARFIPFCLSETDRKMGDGARNETSPDN